MKKQHKTIFLSVTIALIFVPLISGTCFAEVERDSYLCYELDRWLAEGRYARSKWWINDEWMNLYRNALMAEKGTVFKSKKYEFLHDCPWYGRFKKDTSEERVRMILNIKDIENGTMGSFKQMKERLTLVQLAMKTLAALKARDLETLSEMFDGVVYSKSMATDWMGENDNARLTADMILNMTDDSPVVNWIEHGCCGEEDSPPMSGPLKERFFDELFNWEENFNSLVFGPVSSMCENGPHDDAMFTLVNATGKGDTGFGYDICEENTNYYCDKDVPINALTYQVRFIVGAKLKYYPESAIWRIERIAGYCP